MIVARRTFYCKIGKARPFVEMEKQFIQSLMQSFRDAGLPAGKARLLTDLTGKNDRVVVEYEVERWDPAIIQKAAEQATQGHIPREARQQAQQRLEELVESSELEVFTLEHEA